jgi:hypothetical protein
MTNENFMSDSRILMFFLAFVQIHKDEISIKDGSYIIDVKNTNAFMDFFFKKRIMLHPIKPTDFLEDEELVKYHNQDCV